MHHAGDVEGDFREEEIADHVLQAHDQAKEYLAHEEADGRYEIRLGNSLGLILHRMNS